MCFTLGIDDIDCQLTSHTGDKTCEVTCVVNSVRFHCYFNFLFVENIFHYKYNVPAGQQIMI